MEPSPALEHFATPHALQQETRALSKARAPHAPAIHLTKCLLLGIRRLRQAYQARLDAWIHLCRIAIPPSLEGDAQAALHPPRQDAACSLRTWLATPPGQSLLTELRWALILPCWRRWHSTGQLSSKTLPLPGAIHNCPRGMTPSLDWPNRASARRLTSNVYFVAGLVVVLPGRLPAGTLLHALFARHLWVFLVPHATAFCTLARSAVGTTAPTQLISVQTRHPSARTAGSCGPAACKLAHRVAVLRPLWTTSYSTSGSLPTLAKQELAPRQLSPPCCGLSTFGGGYWHTSANAVVQISTACNMTWPPAARLTRRTAPCSACSFWPRKHSARRASPPCNKTSLCRSRCKKD